MVGWKEVSFILVRNGIDVLQALSIHFNLMSLSADVQTIYGILAIDLIAEQQLVIKKLIIIKAFLKSIC